MSELVTLEQEFVRDLFLSIMRNARLQDAITVETLSPEEVLKRAIKQQTNNASVTKDLFFLLQGQFPHRHNPTSKIKQEPIAAVKKNKQAFREKNSNKTNNSNRNAR